MKNIKRLLSALLALTVAAGIVTAVPGASAAQKVQDVFISEICFNPAFEEQGKKFRTNNDFYEYVEIKNIGAEPVDLTNAVLQYSKGGFAGTSVYENSIVFESENDKIMEPGEIWIIGVYTILTPRRGVGYDTEGELEHYWDEFNACYSSSIPVGNRALAVAAESGREVWLPGCTSLPNSGEIGGLRIVAEKQITVDPPEEPTEPTTESADEPTAEPTETAEQGSETQEGEAQSGGESQPTEPAEPDEPIVQTVKYTVCEIEYSPDRYSADGYALQFSLSAAGAVAEGSAGCSPMKIYDYQLPALDSRTAPDGEHFSLISMNVCYAIGSEPAEGTQDDYTVEKRCTRLLSYLNRKNADIICLQEITEAWWDDVMGGLKTRSGVVGESCYGAVGGKSLAVTDSYNLVFYNVSKFDLLDSGNFWLLGDKPSTGNKICSWVILRSRKTGNAFAIFNTHLSANDPKKSTSEFADYTARDSEIEPLASKINAVLALASDKYSTGNEKIPFALCGDFNIDEGSLSYVRLTNTLGVDDAKYAARKNKLSATYNYWGKKTEDNGMIYDYCFIKNGADVESYRVATDRGDDGFLISDHFATEITLCIPSNTFAAEAEAAEPLIFAGHETIWQKIAAFFRQIINWIVSLFS